MAEERRFDIVLLGATGVVGSRAAEHLAARAPASMRWGLAGRDGARLEALRARLAERDPRLEPPAVVVLDAADGEALAELARSARVMMSALGPYLENGGAAVAACAAAGTDYVDVAAEAEFVDGTYLRNQAGALASGARLVHCCGVESLAADLGTRFTVEQLPTGVPIAIDAVLDMGLDGLRDLLGRLSAGSLSSAVAMLARWRRAAAARSERRAREPEPAGRRVRVLRRAPRRGSARGTWLLPAPALDARYVGRSAAALARYGPDFSYSQQVAVSSARAVLETLAGGAAGLLLAQWPPTRRMLLERIERRGRAGAPLRPDGYFRMTFEGRGGGARALTAVSGGDPAYGESPKMFAEAALCLAHDDLPERAGQLTAAVAMGEALIARLQHIGIAFEVLSVPGGS